VISAVALRYLYLAQVNWRQSAYTSREAKASLL